MRFTNRKSPPAFWAISVKHTLFFTKSSHTNQIVDSPLFTTLVQICCRISNQLIHQLRSNNILCLWYYCHALPTYFPASKAAASDQWQQV